LLVPELACTKANFRLIVNGVSRDPFFCLTNPAGKLDLVYIPQELAYSGTFEILNEDPNLRLATGGLIPVQGPYEF